MKLLFSRHALEKMRERKISVEEVKKTISSGETIKEYRHDKPFPSRLVLGFPEGRPLHVVLAEDPEGVKYIITVYEPDPSLWEDGFRRRKKT
ncbi:hypothetical protein Thein_1962 [Thermodesulfatator indicus DSM 15286]|uniref:DUF4258 domain-containing protein n=1 Tax=Thermodesulfatator indicus (strain DSM 15286 / JCM 11887 / CIR29812) TaxID=667014 RepID=F8ACN9_THEID|nr:DUF4258 domain-containing protein [Thermodesulfatator indicus]AEH45816.1 hypothetical protein Thein_1962 [Thermodesulfatator indicus DSM 15286]